MGMTYRMKFNPEICTQHYKPFTTNELVYLCQWYGVLSSREIALALGRTQKSILNKVERLRENGNFEVYRKMYERK